MKILFATTRNRHFLTITEYVEQAVRELGHDLETFEDQAFLVPGRIRSAIPPLHRLDLARVNRRLLRRVHRWRPDLLLCAGGERILPETIDAVRRTGTTTVLWTIDPVKPADPRIPLAPHFDFVFCGGTEMLEALKGSPLKHRPQWLPFGCDPDLHRPVVLSSAERRQYGRELVFVGSLHPDMYGSRLRMLEALATLNLGVWGPGASALPVSSPLHRKICGDEAGYEVWRRIYCASKIVLCAHYSGAGPTSLQASPRVYEALACGAFLLCDDQPDVRALFEDGGDLTIFRDLNDLREKARYYLSHDLKRQEIAQRGRAKVLAHHTYRHRIETLLATVTESK